MPVGKVTQYKPGEDWEFYSTANHITDPQRKKAILLANVPTDTYRLIKDLLAPGKPRDDDILYEQIVRVVQEHVKPERSALVKRYEFDTRVRGQEESVAEFVVKHVAAECKFKDEFRADRLRDRFIADDRMLRTLLSEKLATLTFDRAVEKCIAIERATKDRNTQRTNERRSRAHLEVHLVTTSKVRACY